jgi:hypothetical protein
MAGWRFIENYDDEALGKVRGEAVRAGPVAAEGVYRAEQGPDAEPGRLWDDRHPDAVEMYYDELRKTIGLKRSHESRECAFPVRPKRNSKYMVVYVGTFCNHFRIEITNSVEFNDLTVDREGILELCLTRATGVRRGAR